MSGYSKAADAIVEALMRAGFAAYYVGGCVRDRLRGVAFGDVDIATSAPLAKVKEVFPHAIVVGEAFSVALVDHIEVATFRRDGPYSDFRHPDFVELVSRIEDDLSRRDFTMNAIAEDREGRVVDPYGGQADLAAKRLRFVGDARKRLREDPVRALRACRFAALIGGSIDEHAREAIIEGHDLVARIPHERVQTELSKILMLDRRAVALQLLQELCLLPHVLPRLSQSVGVPQEGYHAEDCWTHAIASAQAIGKRNLALRLAALLHDLAKPQTRVRDDAGADHFYGHEIDGVTLVEDELRDLRYSGDMIAYAQEAVRYHMHTFMFSQDMKDATVRRLMGNLRHMTIRDLLRLQIADTRANMKKPFTDDELRAHLRRALARIRAIERAEHALKITDLAIDGLDVMKLLHVPRGPLVGRILRYCFDQVLQNPALNERETLLQMAKDFTEKRDGQ